MTIIKHTLKYFIMFCLIPHWEQNIQIDAISFSLTSFSTNSDISFVEKFGWNSVTLRLNQAPWRQECTESYNWDDPWPAAEVTAGCCHTHTASWSCISTMSSMNFKYTAQLSMGRDSHSWLHWRHWTLNANWSICDEEFPGQLQDRCHGLSHC